MTIFTIGHSTHSQEEFVNMLHSHYIDMLVDVRSFPGSRKFPHFNKEVMNQWLPQNGISYIHLEKLGGRRRKSKTISEEINAGWTHPSFKSYADYCIESDEFNLGIQELLYLGSIQRVAICCSECLPWRCHRSMISNWLVGIEKVDVQHIMSETKLEQHTLGKWGATPIIEGKKLVYPSAQILLGV